MVRIVGYNERIADDGRTFFALQVQGGIEMIKSKTGSFYATAKKTSIASTFDEETCKALVGTEMSGNVEKVPCPPYEYTIKDSGEVIEISHRYTYVEDEVDTKVSEFQEMFEMAKISENAILA